MNLYKLDGTALKRSFVFNVVPFLFNIYDCERGGLMMKSRNLVYAAILLSVGTVLHFITPPLLFGIKPDFLLVMTFAGIYISHDFKSTLVIGIAAGIIAALTTNFPMGQIPNILDKIISSLFIHQLFKMMDFNGSTLNMAIVNTLGTLVSGLIFLAAALYLTNQLHMFVKTLPIVFLTIPFNVALGEILYRTMTTTVKGLKKI